jgi:alpha-aminoadipic semialdehyde synthase
MNNIIGILREGLNKRGERRVAITPEYAKMIIDWGYKLVVQPAVHPETNENKRAFDDNLYEQSGVDISEDLTSANVIFGLKELNIPRIQDGKTYLFFSHTHKGQKKNRKMLHRLVESKSTLIDYELIADEKNNRLVTAFTYIAGYAGMVDTMWTIGKRISNDGFANSFEGISQAIQGEHLSVAKESMTKAGKAIQMYGTPENYPPMIYCFLGKGKTAFGARKMFNILPHEDINLNQLEDVYTNGSRKKVYALQIDVEEIYRLKGGSKINHQEYNQLNTREKQRYYFNNPEDFESNLDIVLPCVSVVMNFIIWSGKYPRTVTKVLMRDIYKKNKSLLAIGDITCDPNGSIEFSKETWIDNPVYIYDPQSESINDGFRGDGIAVMAVTNLPCEFSADASQEFSKDLEPFLKNIISADYKKSFDDVNLLPEIKGAVIMWRGEFTERYKYMKDFLN